MNISIKGAYGDSNYGDDLLMIVLEDYFIKKLPNYNLNFVGANNQYVEKLLQKSTYNFQQKDDVLIYGGGTQFFSFIEKSTLQTKFKNNIKKNPLIVINKILKKIAPSKEEILEPEKAFIGFGLGPFNNNVQAINYAKQQLQQSFFIGVRDQVSYNYCNEWGINALLGADIVFSSYFKQHISEVKGEPIKNKIGIIVRDWDWKNSNVNYQEKILEFVNNNKEIDVTFIVFAKDKDPDWLKKIKNHKHLIWEPERMSIQSFLNELNTFETFITARYHGAIIAGLMNKKVICIEIEPKLRILTEQIPSFSLWNNHFDLNELKEILESELKQNHEEFILNLREKADRMLEDFTLIFKQKFDGK